LHMSAEVVKKEDRTIDATTDEQVDTASEHQDPAYLQPTLPEPSEEPPRIPPALLNNDSVSGYANDMWSELHKARAAAYRQEERNSALLASALATERHHAAESAMWAWERDVFARENEALVEERDALIRERDALVEERDSLAVQLKQEQLLVAMRDSSIKHLLSQVLERAPPETEVAAVSDSLGASEASAVAAAVSTKRKAPEDDSAEDSSKYVHIHIYI
jgi:hypothetical protein